MKTKTVLITGATSGVGFATAKALASRGFNVVLLARNEEKVNKTVALLKKLAPEASIDFVLGDLSDLASIKSAAAAFQAKYNTLDVLINNAGGIFDTYEKTKDGFEWGFQVNHLGHYYLTKLLKKELLSSTEPRVINLSSEAHKMGKFDIENLNCEKKFSGWGQYGSTKLMNILFTKGLVENFENINAYAVHPGVVKTGFGANNGGLLKYFSWMPFLITPEQGAETSVHLATAPISELKNGYYYKKSKPAAIAKNGIDHNYRDQLWDVSKKLLKSKGFVV
ncbi:NAD(P)-dependent dehydrogenase, short-chain alcohol dehydrogenase family [Spirosomataceae bacterium TFI 002]|nr:NAD(P)-dependent dehydrogenase, short-chain alcohol dehydrogenase family [Spirosomataceae bacterium TFI 002]